MKEIVRNLSVNSHDIAVALHDAGNKSIVIFCHGFRGTNVGPNCFFVRTARKLADQSVSSLRFDQYGSGNSEGDFFDSSFKDWVATTREIVRHYLKQRYKVSLLGQSMGGSAVITVASEITDLSSIVAWAPDLNIEEFIPPKNGVVEENGQIVQARFWQEAHDAKIAEKLPLVKTRAYIVQCASDEYVDKRNRDAISKNAQPHHRVEIFENYSHSGWTFEQSEEVISKSVDFLAECFLD
ncbi:MAG: alpha/beta fold hydrolase [Candidatus Liptonbacteria bacterium]|nr:alpha/beta fold hydrolase [Candidatus Liptonbacteria bacterium]